MQDYPQELYEFSGLRTQVIQYDEQIRELEREKIKCMREFISDNSSRIKEEIEALETEATQLYLKISALEEKLCRNGCHCQGVYDLTYDKKLLKTEDKHKYFDALKTYYTVSRCKICGKLLHVTKFEYSRKENQYVATEEPLDNSFIQFAIGPRTLSDIEIAVSNFKRDCGYTYINVKNVRGADDTISHIGGYARRIRRLKEDIAKRRESLKKIQTIQDTIAEED